MVAVLFAIYPETILVAPYSPSPLANDKTSPAIIPDLQFGMIIRQKIYVFDFPRVFPAKTRFLSNASKELLAVRYIRGKLIMQTAITEAYHFIVTTSPKHSESHEPNALFGEITVSIKKPTTVGGKTSGIVKTVSHKPFKKCGSLTT